MEALRVLKQEEIELVGGGWHVDMKKPEKKKPYHPVHEKKKHEKKPKYC